MGALNTGATDRKCGIDVQPLELNMKLVCGRKIPTQFSDKLCVFFSYCPVIFDLVQLRDDTRKATVAVRGNDIPFQSKRSEVSFQRVKIDRSLRIGVQNIRTFGCSTSKEENGFFFNQGKAKAFRLQVSSSQTVDVT